MTTKSNGHDLRVFREELGISQERAAKILDMSLRTYWNYEADIKNIKNYELVGIKETLKKGIENERK